MLKLKVWDDDETGARWKKSVTEMKYQVLLVSQFTLLANTKKGNKPDFHGACPPNLACDMYTSLVEQTREFYTQERKLPREEGCKWVQDGVFGAMMQVALVNDGPVTFEINSPPKQPPSEKGTAKGTPKGTSKKGTPKGTPKGAPKLAETLLAEAIAEKVEEMSVSQKS